MGSWQPPRSWYGPALEKEIQVDVEPVIPVFPVGCKPVIHSDDEILVDGQVISAPRVAQEIKFGKCRISGNLNQDEAAAIKELLEQ